MTRKVKLSEKALAVCKKHYGTWNKCGCGTCPLHKLCTANHHWSFEGLDQHSANINAAAELIELEQ